MKADVLPQEDYFNWSLNQLARAFGIARETVAKRLTDAGVSPSGARRGHSVYAVKAAAKAILVPNLMAGEFNNPDVMAPQDRKAWFSSERDRIALEKEQGLLVGVEDCRQQIVEVINIGLPIFESFADEMECDFGLDPKIITAIDERVDNIRNKWADAIEETS